MVSGLGLRVTGRRLGNHVIPGFASRSAGRKMYCKVHQVLEPNLSAVHYGEAIRVYELHATANDAIPSTGMVESDGFCLTKSTGTFQGGRNERKGLVEECRRILGRVF